MEGIVMAKKAKRTVRAIVVRVGQAPVVEEIGTDLADMQKIVGGYVEAVALEGGITMWANEEGVFTCPFNRNVPGRAPVIPPGWDVISRPADAAAPGTMGVHKVHGDFFLVRSRGSGMASVTDKDVATWTKTLGA